MLLDVPLLPDEHYCRFLAAELGPRDSVHFSLASTEVADARNPLEFQHPVELVRSLRLLGGATPRYALLNARIQDPARYFDPEHLRGVADLLARLADEAGLTGIVVADGYYLRALGQAAPELAARLEGVPSVNCMVDSLPRAASWLRLVQASGFRLPSRLVLDRSLNRDPGRLGAVAEDLRERWPDMKLLLLANEGCLPDCPYKPAHDAHLAVARMPGCGDRTFAMNTGLGCVADVDAQPWRLFTSPFIRPEDAHRLEGVADGLKLCGRERGGPAFLRRLVRAYASGRHAGNLLSLMDTLGEFEHRFFVDNERLPGDFYERVSDCDRACLSPCRECAALGRFVERTDPGLPDLRGGE